MKLTTLLKSYKIALYEISRRVSDWDRVYIGTVEVPEKDKNITFIFSDTKDMSYGSIGLKVSFHTSKIESIPTVWDDDVDKLKKSAPNEINDAGKFLIVILSMMQQVEKIASSNDEVERVEVISVYFNVDKNTVTFNLAFDNYKMSICTDGDFYLFSELESL